MATPKSDITLYREGSTAEVDSFVVDGIHIDGATSHLGYITRMQKVLKYLKPDLRFDAAYPEWVTTKKPPNRVEDGIVWSVRKMLPWKLGGKIDDSRNVGTREVASRQRTVLRDKGTGKETMIQAQRFTVFYQFDIFATNPNKAEEIADWFQFAFMWFFGGLFGAMHTEFRQRLRDKEVEKLNQTMCVRTLEYAVDIEKRAGVEMPVINKIEISLQGVE